MSTAAAQHCVEYLGIKFHPAIEAAMMDAQRNIATARLRAFEDECFLLGEIARRYDQQPAISDFLYRVAEANGLVTAHGDGLIHMMMVAGMRGDA